MRVPDFEIDVKKVNWTPKHVEEIAKAASRALETELTFEELGRVVGTDHIEKIPIKKDEDILKFSDIKAKTRFEEKVIRFKIPERAFPKDFVPKKVKILAKGKRVAKFFGECQVSTRQVEFSLKLFECGHFYLKQALPGAGSSPYWVIFEGRYERTAKGYQLDYQLRYSWQNAKARPGQVDFAIEAVPAQHRSRLAWCGELPEQQLNGSVPAIVGEEAWCWIEICREPDVVEQGPARFNEEPDEPPPPVFPAPSAKPSSEGATREGEVRSRRGAGPEQTTPAARASGFTAGKSEEESMVPMFVGLVLFLMLFITFFRGWWEDSHAALEKM